MKRMLEQNRLEVKAAKVLPRDKEVVATVFRQLADSGSVELIITTGATGYLEQDCAPKAVEEVAEQLIPGIPEALRAYNLRYSKKAMLDCMAAGIRKNTLIVNLPESAKTAKEDMEYILSGIMIIITRKFSGCRKNSGIYNILFLQMYMNWLLILRKTIKSFI